MKILINKLFPILLAFFVAFLGANAWAQEEIDPPEQEEDAVPFRLTLQGRDITIDPEKEVEEEGRPLATGRPLDIEPTPYFDREEGVPLRLAQQEDLDEENVEEGEEDALEATDLDPLNTDSIGLLSPTRGGYPLGLWQGSAAADIYSLMAALPSGSSSPTANAMKRKLLLSAAPFPLDSGEDFENQYGPEDFLYSRLERLHAGGDLASLLRLFEQIPRTERSPRISRLMVEAYLLDGDLTSACKLAADGQREEGSSDWLKIRSICLVLEGEEAQARFNLTLLDETGEIDFAYQTLFEDVVALARETTNQVRAGAAAQQDPGFSSYFAGSFFLSSDLSPLHVAILKLLGRNVDIALEEEVPTNMMLTSMARWQGLTLETKLKVADQALSQGILEERFLKNLVGAYTFEAADKEIAHLLDYESWGVKGDALFYALAKEAGDAEAAISAIQEGWSRARMGGRAPFIAGLYLDAILDIPPSPAFVAFAPDAVRIALLNDRWDLARDWYAIARNTASSGDAEATRMLVEMWPLMVTMDKAREIPYSPQILRLWRRGVELLPGDEQLARALLLYSVLEVLNYPVPEDLKSEGVFARSVSSGANFIGGPSLGETLLRVLGSFGASGPEVVAPTVLADIMKTLIDTGLDNDARHLALETLIARGF